MQRVMIVGAPGSGKSTLARLLGDQTGLPVYHMDQIHWAPGWEMRPRDQRIKEAIAIEKRSEWIFEGGLSATYPHRLEQCDTLIWLDIPVPLRLWRVTRRMLLGYGRTRFDMAEGCEERFGAHTLDFYRYIWTSRHRARARIAAMAEAPPRHVTVHHLRSLREVTAFLDDAAFAYA